MTRIKKINVKNKKLPKNKDMMKNPKTPPKNREKRKEIE